MRILYAGRNALDKSVYGEGLPRGMGQSKDGLQKKISFHGECHMQPL